MYVYSFPVVEFTEYPMYYFYIGFIFNPEFENSIENMC